jgi:hypothetical protein
MNTDKDSDANMLPLISVLSVPSVVDYELLCNSLYDQRRRLNGIVSDSDRGQ